MDLFTLWRDTGVLSGPLAPRLILLIGVIVIILLAVGIVLLGRRQLPSPEAMEREKARSAKKKRKPRRKPNAVKRAPSAPPRKTGAKPAGPTAGQKGKRPPEKKPASAAGTPPAVKRKKPVDPAGKTQETREREKDMFPGTAREVRSSMPHGLLSFGRLLHDEDKWEDEEWEAEEEERRRAEESAASEPEPRSGEEHDGSPAEDPADPDLTE